MNTICILRTKELSCQFNSVYKCTCTFDYDYEFMIIVIRKCMISDYTMITAKICNHDYDYQLFITITQTLTI